MPIAGLYGRDVAIAVSTTKSSDFPTLLMVCSDGPHALSWWSGCKKIESAAGTIGLHLLRKLGRVGSVSLIPVPPLQIFNNSLNVP
jgi:hypothetical protein